MKTQCEADRVGPSIIGSTFSISVQRVGTEKDHKSNTRMLVEPIVDRLHSLNFTHFMEMFPKWLMARRIPVCAVISDRVLRRLQYYNFQRVSVLAAYNGTVLF